MTVQPGAISVWQPRRNKRPVPGGVVRGFIPGSGTPKKIYTGIDDRVGSLSLRLDDSGDLPYALDGRTELVAYDRGGNNEFAREVITPFATETPLPEGSSSSRGLSVDQLISAPGFTHDGANSFNSETQHLVSGLQTGSRAELEGYGNLDLGFFLVAGLARCRFQAWLHMAVGTDSIAVAGGPNRVGWRGPDGTFYDTRSFLLSQPKETFQAVGQKIDADLDMKDFTRAFTVPFQNFGAYPAGCPWRLEIRIVGEGNAHLANDSTGRVDPIGGNPAIYLKQVNPRRGIPDPGGEFESTLRSLLAETSSQKSQSEAEAQRSRSERVLARRARQDAQAIANEVNAALARNRNLVRDTGDVTLASLLSNPEQVQLGYLQIESIDGETINYRWHTVAPGAPQNLIELLDTPGAITADNILIGNAAGNLENIEFNFSNLKDLPDTEDAEGNALSGRSYVVGATPDSIVLGPKVEEQIRSIFRLDDVNIPNPGTKLGALLYIADDGRVGAIGQGALAQIPELKGDEGARGPRGDSHRIIFAKTNGARPADPAGRGAVIPAGWSQDPDTAPGAGDVFWWAEAFQNAGDWSQWSSAYRLTGDDGAGTVLIFARAAVKPNRPAGRGPAEPGLGWGLSPGQGPNPLWMSASSLNAPGGQWSLWGDPTQVSGEKGVDGDDVRWVFRRSVVNPGRPDGVAPSPNAGQALWVGNPDRTQGNAILWASFTSARNGGAWQAWSLPLQLTGPPGDSVRHAYIRSAAKPAAPAGAPPVAGGNWQADPGQLPDNANPVWWSTTTKTGDAAWTAWSDPVKYIEHGEDGQDGDGVRIRFRRSAAAPATPARNGGTNANPAGWSSRASQAAPPNDAPDAPLYWTLSTYDGETDTWSAWDQPTQVQGDKGVKGDKGDGQVLFYRRFGGNVPPRTPAGTGPDAPADWTSLANLRAGNPDIWAVESVFKDGAWSAFSAPRRWSGQPGQDGERGPEGGGEVPRSILKQQTLPADDVTAIPQGSTDEVVKEVLFEIPANSDKAGLGTSVATGAGRPEFDNVHADEDTWLEANGRLGIAMEQSGAGTIRIFQERRTKADDSAVAETFEESEHPIQAYGARTYFNLPLTATQIRALTQNTYPVKIGFKPDAAPAHANGRFGLPANPQDDDLISYKRVREAAAGGGGNDPRLPAIGEGNVDEGKTLKIRNGAYAKEQEPDIPDNIPEPLRDKELFYEVRAQRDQNGNPTGVPIIAYADQALLKDIQVVHSFDDIVPTADGKMYYLTAHSRGYEPGLYIIDIDPDIVVNEIKVKGVVNPQAATQKGALNNPANTFGTIRAEDEAGFGGIVVDDSVGAKYYAFWLDSAIAQGMVFFQLSLGNLLLGSNLNRGAVDGNIVNLGHTYREYQQAVAALPALLQNWFADPAQELTIRLYRSVNNARGAVLGFKNPLRVRRYINQGHAADLEEDDRENRLLHLARIGADFGVVPDYKNRIVALADDVRSRGFQLFALLDQDARSTDLDLRITRPGYAGVGGAKGRTSERGRARVRTTRWGNGRGQFWTAAMARATRLTFANVKEQQKLNNQNLFDYITLGDRGADPGREAYIEIGLKSADYADGQVSIQLLNLRNAADTGNRNPLQFQLPRVSGDAEGFGPGHPRVRVFRYYLTAAQASAAELNIQSWAFEGGAPDFRLTTSTIGGRVVPLNPDEVQFTSGPDYAEPQNAIAAAAQQIGLPPVPHESNIAIPAFRHNTRAGIFPRPLDVNYRILQHVVTAEEASLLARIDLSCGMEITGLADGIRVHAGMYLQRIPRGQGSAQAEHLYLWDGYNRNRNAAALRHRVCHMHWEGRLNEGDTLNLYDVTGIESSSGQLEAWNGTSGGSVRVNNRMRIISPRYAA